MYKFILDWYVNILKMFVDSMAWGSKMWIDCDELL